jgi:2,3-dihydroxy-p-cumate/2,3-dihydroxybenzoate 3,4-dioxygenase
MQHRYAGLGYVAINVSDLARSADFYQRLWGLQPNGKARDGSLFFRCGPDHHDLILCRGEPGLKRVAWRLETERDLDLVAEAIRGAGHEVVAVDAAEADDLHLGRALRFSDPYTGATHEYFVTMAQAAGVWTPTVAAIQRMVEEIDDIGRGLWRFNKNNVPVVRGPGRHPPSGSVFLYVLDPDGITVEYSYGMEEFPEQDAREHRVLPPVPESIDYWDGPTDPRLGKIGVIEQM